MQGVEKYPATFGIEPQVYRRRWFILGVLCVSLVVIVMGVSSVNVLLPTLGSAKASGGLGANGSQLQWIVDAYVLVFAGLLLLCGALGDRFGRKSILLVGLGCFAATAAMASKANGPTELIALRALAGIGAALIMPATLSIILNCFPIEERPKAVSTWAAFAGLGGATGLLVGGWILNQGFWWGAVFILNVPIALLLIIAVVRYVPNSRGPAGHSLDLVGAVLSVVAAVSIVFAVIEGPERGWFNNVTVISFVVGLVTGILWIKWELNTRTPMLDPRLFKIPGFRMGSIVVTTAFFCMFGLMFVLTQYFQYVKGYSPFSAAVHQLPFPITMLFWGPQSPKLVGKFGVRTVQRIGFGSLAMGFALMALIDESTPYFQVFVALVLLSTGIAWCSAPASQLIVGSLPLSKAGVGSAMNDVTRELGGALGIAVLGSVTASAYKNNIEGASSLSSVGDGHLVHLIKESYASAQQAVQLMAAQGNQAAGSVAVDARHAFVLAVPNAFLASSIICVAAALLIPRWIPNSLPHRIRPAHDGTGNGSTDVKGVSLSQKDS